MSATHPTSLRDRRRTELLTLILDTAQRLFAQHGFAAVTTDEIAATAGISISTYYRHAPSKERLLTAPVEQAIASITTSYNTRPCTESVADSFINFLADSLGKIADHNSGHWKQAMQTAPHLFNDTALICDNQTRQLVATVASRMDTDPATDIRPALLIHTGLATAKVVLQRWLDTNTAAYPPLHIQLEQALRITLAGFH